MSAILFIACCFGICLIALVIMWKYSRKEITINEDENSCNVIKMFPVDDDPEYTVGGSENTPSWEKIQNN